MSRVWFGDGGPGPGPDSRPPGAEGDKSSKEMENPKHTPGRSTRRIRVKTSLPLGATLRRMRVNSSVHDRRFPCYTGFFTQSAYANFIPKGS
jgi:hypothetical protein